MGDALDDRGNAEESATIKERDRSHDEGARGTVDRKGGREPDAISDTGRIRARNYTRLSRPAWKHVLQIRAGGRKEV